MQVEVGEDPDNVRSCFLEHDIDVGVYGIRFTRSDVNGVELHRDLRRALGTNLP